MAFHKKDLPTHRLIYGRYLKLCARLRAERYRKWAVYEVIE